MIDRIHPARWLTTGCRRRDACAGLRRADLIDDVSALSFMLRFPNLASATLPWWFSAEEPAV